MRSGYTDQLDGPDLAMYRGRVASAIRGQRGQQLLRDCLTALDAMAEKRLIPNVLVDGNDVCLLGAVGRFRRVPDLEFIDPEAHETLSERLNAAKCLIQEIEWVNDECAPYSSETPEHRFERVRKWVTENLVAKR